MEKPSKRYEQDAIWTRAGFPTAALMQHLNHLVTCPIKIRGVFRVDRTPEPSDQKLHCLDVTSVGRSPNWAIKTKNLEVDVRLPGIEPGFPRQNLVITHCWIIWKWQREVLAIGQQTLLFWIGWRLDSAIFTIYSSWIDSGYNYSIGGSLILVYVVGLGW